MRFLGAILLSSAISALLPCTSLAIDLAKIDRRVGTLPKWTAVQQGYCLVVFGPEARTRVWLVQDGDILYADRNGNGNLTDPGERFDFSTFRHVDLGDIVDVTDGVTYKNFRASRVRDQLRVSVETPKWGRQWAREDMHGKLLFSEHPKDAPIIHFGGPLEFSLDSPPNWGDGTDSYISFQAVLGTRGLGKGTFALIVPRNDFLEQFNGFACSATFTDSAPGATPIVLRYSFDCY